MLLLPRWSVLLVQHRAPRNHLCGAHAIAHTQQTKNTHLLHVGVLDPLYFQ